MLSCEGSQSPCSPQETKVESDIGSKGNVLLGSRRNETFSTPYLVYFPRLTLGKCNIFKASSCVLNVIYFLSLIYQSILNHF